MKRFYLDHNAATAIRPEVVAMSHEIMSQTGNASSVHTSGRAARSHVEHAREQVALLCGVQSPQVVFTSSATESNNTVLNAFRDERILVSAIEHPSVMEAAPGAEIIPATKDGVIDEVAFAAMMDQGPAPALISIMMVNNETGVIQDISSLAKIARKKHPGIYIHCDAVQAAGKIKIDFPSLHLDYLSLSAHKCGGPQGVGALILSPGAKPVKFMHGGGQEKRQRAGTENVAGIAGFGFAAQIAQGNIEDYSKLAALRDRLEAEIKKATPDAIILGAQAQRVANTACIAVPGVNAQTLLMALDLEGIACSSGAACSSGTVKTSAVAKAMGIPENYLNGVMRFSLGWNSTTADIDAAIAAWLKVIPRLKK